MMRILIILVTYRFMEKKNDDIGVYLDLLFRNYSRIHVLGAIKKQSETVEKFEREVSELCGC